MSEPREPGTPEKDGTTLVTPRFDEEETVLAQPVVPLEEGEGLTPPAAAEAAPVAPTAPPYARAGRRQWPLALILISALVGSVIGGTGLYFFQKQRRANAPQPAASAAPVESAPPAAEQAAEVAPEASAPVEPAAEEPEPRADAALDEEDPEPAGEDADAPRAERLPATPPSREAGPRKHGKKAEGEDERSRRERRTARDDEAPAETGREARRVDSIVYPSRREERRAQRREERRAARRERRAARNVDRLRAIFEGQP